MSGRADAVIFDFDDNLVATSDAWQQAYDLTCGQAAAQDACADPAALAASYRAASDAPWSGRPRVLAPLGLVFAIRCHVWGQALRARGAALPGSGLDQLVSDSAAVQLAAIRPDPLSPGLLALLARRCPVTARSTGDSIQIRAKLARVDLLPALGVITFGMDEQIRRPDPELLHRCCRALGLPPRRCLHVGDDWHNDVDAARIAGCVLSGSAAGRNAAPGGQPPTARHATTTECWRDHLHPKAARPGRRA